MHIQSPPEQALSIISSHQQPEIIQNDLQIEVIPPQEMEINHQPVDQE